MPRPSGVRTHDLDLEGDQPFFGPALTTELSGRSLSIIAVITALGLASCGPASHIDVAPVTELGETLAAPPADIVAPCADPVLVPNKALPAGQVATLWASDRAALVWCRDSKAGETQFYTSRDKGLAGK